MGIKKNSRPRHVSSNKNKEGRTAMYLCIKKRRIAFGWPGMLILLWFLSGSVTADNATIQPVHDEDILAILTPTTPDQIGLKPEAIQLLMQYPKERRTAAIAYALGDPRRFPTAIQIIIDHEAMRDPRLATYLAEAMTRARGETLLQAARAARFIPSRILVPALLTYGVTSPYADIRMIKVRNQYERHYATVFAEAAEALYIITDGRIGMKRVERHRILSEAKREALIKEWQHTWETESGDEEQVKD